MSKRGNQRNRRERQQLVRREEQLTAPVVKSLDMVAETIDTIERKIGNDESRQPRFTTPTSIFSSVFRWTLTGILSEPGGYATTRQWDAWYREFSKREPFLVSVLNAATQIDRNRGWTLTGGQRQVKKYTDVLHALDDGQGWRTHIDWQAQSYYTTRMGFVAEVGREGRGGPLATLWSVDPCRCEMSGNPETPLRYYPRVGGMQEWKSDYFIRGKSLVSTDEAQLDNGYPAVARCYDLAKIMLGVYSHYQQKLNTKTPDGILTGRFISEEQWDEAMRARAESLRANPEAYLNSIATITSSGGDMPEFALTLLSSMPDRWDIDTWTKLLMRGYELAFGYQGEFYPESAGVLGRGNEVQIQHRNATAQGGKDFSLTYQEQLQSVLPPTLEFQFEERDVGGETEDANLQLAKAQVITEMTKWVVNGQSVLTVPQIMTLAAEQGVVPDEWTPQDEDVTATDEEEVGENATPALLSERVQRAMRAFPSEPIVRHSWPSGKTCILRAATRRSFYVPKATRFNPNHEPAGSSEGGQFASGGGGNDADEDGGNGNRLSDSIKKYSSDDDENEIKNTADDMFSRLEEQYPDIFNKEDSQDFVNNALYDWSQDNNKGKSKYFQLAASKEFDVGLSDYSKKVLGDQVSFLADSYRAMLRDSYENTQEWFRSIGIGEDTLITLFRGTESNYINSLNSWTPDEDIARFYAKRNSTSKKKAKVYKITVPAKYIVGTPRTGLGLPSAKEFVVLGKYASKDIKISRSFVARSVNEVVTNYRDRLTRWVYEAMTGKMDKTDLSRAHKALIRATAQDAYYEGMREGGIASPADDATEQDSAAIKEWVTAQVGHVDGFAHAAVDVFNDESKRPAILSRVDLWADSVSGLGNAGLLSAKSDRPAIWHLGPTETHCPECAALDGKRHRVSWFLKKGYLPHTPPNAQLGCDGWGKCFISDAVTGERIGA